MRVVQIAPPWFRIPPIGIDHLELLDIPGRWGRIDGFGRGRVDVKKKLRVQGGTR